jgi:hypothetical protein
MKMFLSGYKQFFLDISSLLNTLLLTVVYLLIISPTSIFMKRNIWKNGWRKIRESDEYKKY